MHFTWKQFFATMFVVICIIAFGCMIVKHKFDDKDKAIKILKTEITDLRQAISSQPYNEFEFTSDLNDGMSVRIKVKYQEDYFISYEQRYRMTKAIKDVLTEQNVIPANYRDIIRQKASTMTAEEIYKRESLKDLSTIEIHSEDASKFLYDFPVK